jgi:hypothetical protein
MLGITRLLNTISFNRIERKDRKEMQWNGAEQGGGQSRSFAGNCVPNLEIGNEKEARMMYIG